MMAGRLNAQTLHHHHHHHQQLYSSRSRPVGSAFSSFLKEAQQQAAAASAAPSAPSLSASAGGGDDNPLPDLPASSPASASPLLAPVRASILKNDLLYLLLRGLPELTQQQQQQRA
jgi:hypothetical protein